MSTQPTQTDPETRPTMTPQETTYGAQMMFATDNHVPIQGLFDTERSDTPY